jgi:CDP-alcohol phosphatidyltransferase-like enzyme
VEPPVKRLSDWIVGPLVRLLHEGLGLGPAQVTWASFWASAAAAAAIGTGRLPLGLAFMALGQVLDGLDGGIARTYGLASEQGHRLDTLLDRASESLIFLAFAVAGLVPLTHALLALAAVLLLTTVCDRSGLDPGFKRFVLYFGIWVPYPTLFAVIFGVNLAAYVIGLLIIDCQFQTRMDLLGGDLDTVASRAARLEGTEVAGVEATPAPAADPS